MIGLSEGTQDICGQLYGPRLYSGGLKAFIWVTRLGVISLVLSGP